MTEELVTLETAKLLKEKGFDWKCEHLIDRNKVITKYNLPQSMSCCTEIDGESVEFCVQHCISPKSGCVKPRTYILK